MAASVVGMITAAFGYLPPLEGAILQEIIDLAAVVNAARVALPTRELADFGPSNLLLGSVSVPSEKVVTSDNEARDETSQHHGLVAAASHVGADQDDGK
jgi:hypothetical protein